MTGYIYFIRCGKFVKIGFSHEPEARKRELELGNPEDCILVGMHEGTIEDEKHLHRYFLSHHHRLEWFRWCADIDSVARTGLPQMIRGSRAKLRLRQLRKERRSPFEVRHLQKKTRPLSPSPSPKINDPLLKTVLRQLTDADLRVLHIPNDPNESGYVVNASNPGERLAVYLRRRMAEYSQFAWRAGVNSRQAANAVLGRPVATIPYLRLATACGFDPCPDLPAPAVEPSDFDAALFGLALNIRRQLREDSDRDAAEIMGLSASTVCRIEKGHIVNIGVVLSACRYIGVHPFGYLAPQQKKPTAQNDNLVRSATRETWKT